VSLGLDSCACYSRSFAPRLHLSCIPHPTWASKCIALPSLCLDATGLPLLHVIQPGAGLPLPCLAIRSGRHCDSTVLVVTVWTKVIVGTCNNDLRSLLLPWFLCWCHCWWCGVKNSFGILVYCKEYTFPILLNFSSYTNFGQFLCIYFSASQTFWSCNSPNLIKKFQGSPDPTTKILVRSQ
jgi:hypothetical protein